MKQQLQGSPILINTTHASPKVNEANHGRVLFFKVVVFFQSAWDAAPGPRPEMRVLLPGKGEGWRDGMSLRSLQPVSEEGFEKQI